MDARRPRGFELGSLCEDCAHVREVVSAGGSRFLLCRLSASDPRFPKYPPQPVLHCEGHRPEAPA